MVTPFVVTGALAADPQSAAGRYIQAMRTPWASRKLVFFAGHVPALHNSEVRYLIWRQLRRDVRATTKSHTINCTIGQYAVCRRPMRWLRKQPNSFFINACKSSCGAGAQCGASERSTPDQNLQRLSRKCKRYKTVDFEAEASDYARDSALRWSDRQYLREAMQHRFCLIARGDFPSTPKIAELLAVGAAGGCLPVFVLDFPRSSTRPSQAAVQGAMARTLPFSSWLQYCSFSYFVSRKAAERDMPGVLRALESVSAAEAQEKLAALGKLRSVFGFQNNSTPEMPSATDHIFAEMCTRAKLRRASGSFSDRGAMASTVLGSSGDRQLWSVAEGLLHTGGLPSQASCMVDARMEGTPPTAEVFPEPNSKRLVARRGRQRTPQA